MSFEKTLEDKLGPEKAQKVIEEIKKGAGKSEKDLKSHIDKAMRDLQITDPDITSLSTTIARQVKAQ